MEDKGLDVYISIIKDTALEELPEEAEYFERQRRVDRAIFKAGMQVVVNFINKCYSFPIRPADGIQYWDTWREKWETFLKENGLES